jgi:hypothetical protein
LGKEDLALRSVLKPVPPRHPDTPPGIDKPGTAVDDPARFRESAIMAPPSRRQPPTDPQLATPAFVTPRRPQQRARRGRASRLLTLARSLWIILRERAK